MLSIQELRSSSKKELLLELQKARKEMVKIRISLKTKHEKDTSKARKEKRLIAQILTLLNGFDKEPVAKSAKQSPAKATEVTTKPLPAKATEIATKPATKKPTTKKVSKKNS